ncbi:MAG TPA: hypothetical protein VJX66_24470 [Amycolatopsis sp.]|nr:hypothetical protein [Amycolatopsis sp.]
MRDRAVRTPRSALLTAVLAAVVTIGALVFVFVARPHPAPPAGSAGEPAAVPPSATTTCGSEPCRQLAAMTVGGQPVVLLADASGGSGRLRFGPEPGTVFELTIGELGARLDANSLRCIDGSTAACLVRGQVDGGAYGEVLAGRGGLWHDPGKPYFADAGTLTLGDVNADGVPDVIVVRHECPGAESGTPKCEAAPVLAQVYDLGGETLGCTRKVTSPSDLRGWPEVRLTRADLRSC